MDTKICTKCNEEYPRTKEYFPSHKGCKDNLDSWCRKCRNIATKTWQEENPEYKKEYRQKHRKECRENQEEYRKTLKGYIIRLMDNIKARCSNPKATGYKNYGGRGIKCLFNSAQLFAWIVANNIEPRGRDIHRVDNDDNYTLENIKFLEHGLHISLHKSMQEER